MAPTNVNANRNLYSDYSLLKLSAFATFMSKDEILRFSDFPGFLKSRNFFYSESRRIFKRFRERNQFFKTAKFDN